MKKAAALRFLCGVVIVAGGICFFCRGCYDESEIRSSDDNARSNDDLAKSYKSQLDAANATVVNLKVDAAEMKREKDAQIATLNTENASLKQRVTFLEALPAAAFLAVSNAGVLIKTESTAPSYQLKINGFGLTNYIVGNAYVIPLKNTRDISLEVSAVKEGEKSVEKLNINFISLLAPTNFVVDTVEGHWKFVGGRLSFLGKKNATCLEMVSQYTLTPISVSPVESKPATKGRIEPATGFS